MYGIFDFILTASKEKAKNASDHISSKSDHTDQTTPFFLFRYIRIYLDVSDDNASRSWQLFRDGGKG